MFLRLIIIHLNIISFISILPVQSSDLKPMQVLPKQPTTTFLQAQIPEFNKTKPRTVYTTLLSDQTVSTSKISNINQLQSPNINQPATSTTSLLQSFNTNQPASSTSSPPQTSNTNQPSGRNINFFV